MANTGMPQIIDAPYSQDGSITQKQEENAEHRRLWAFSAVILLGSSHL